MASVAALVIVAIAYAVIEGDLLENLLNLRHGFFTLLRHLGLARFGTTGALALLYVEESGVPLPVPGDVYVAYLGHLAAGSTTRLLAAWVTIIAIVVAGSSNLYLISRRWGPKVIEHPLASVLHLEPARLARARAWFKRWGVLAVVFGRHIPGFRVPITVLAGTLAFPYRLFAPSVAVSTAIWAGAVILLAAQFGKVLTRFIGSHRWVYGVGTLLAVAFLIVIGIRAARAVRESSAGTRPGQPRSDQL
jgi:membrane protein DedA with SNARE-associated domain